MYISLPLFCTTTTLNFKKLPSYTFYGGNIVCVPVHFFFSLPLIFHLAAASISPFSHRGYKIITFFFQKNWSPLVFISRSSSFSVIHVNATLKLSRKKESAFVVVFISKTPGSYRKIPKISPSKCKPPKPVTQKTLC